MSQDLFGDTLVQPSRSRLRRLLAVWSAVLHALVLATIIVIQVFAVGPLPLPRRPLIFEEIRLVHLTDIHVPAPPHAPMRSTAETVAPNAAPIVEPRGVASETGLENVAPAASAGTSVEGGVEGIGSIGPIVTAPPPPPAPPAPPPPVRLHPGIVAPKKVVDVTPVYPSLAQAAHVTGIVILEAVIDTSGTVTSVQVLRSVPLLDQAAVDAVRQWRYTPARLNERPVPVIVTVTINFSM